MSPLSVRGRGPIKESKFTEEQITYALGYAESGTPSAENVPT